MIKIRAAVLLLIFITLLSFFDIQKSNAGNAVSFNKEGWEHLKKGDSYKAVFSFKNSLKNNPDYKDAIIGLATAYYRIEVYDEAFDLFTLALKKDKNSVESYTGLGFTLAGLGRYTEALEFFEKSISLSEENLEAKYGIAYIYFMMGKKIWAKRKIESILVQNPYHYDSLLLMAEIKSSDKRLSDAKKLIEKAIDANTENPAGYVKLAEILFKSYLHTEDSDFFSEAEQSLKNALSIQPQNYQANRLFGNIMLVKKNYTSAAAYFEKAGADNSSMLYNLAVAYDMSGDHDKALGYFLKALKKFPSDSILRSRIEDFFVSREYKIGNPVRVMLSRELYNLAIQKEKKHLTDEVLMYLRRALLMNPMMKEPRELLLDYYKTLDYNRFYINELKEFLRLYPSSINQERLNIAIIQRRNQLYHTEGYSMETPPRDVPKILVLNFESEGKIANHFDTGTIISSNLTFVLGQFGRMETPGIRKRNDLAEDLKSGDGWLEKAMTSLGEKQKNGDISNIDYIVYGTFDENGGRLSANYNILDFSRGVVIGQFSLFESEKEAIPRLSVRAAKRIFNLIPYKGRVLKLRDDGIVVNLGLYDGVKPGDKFYISKINYKEKKSFNKIRKIFTVKDANTLVSLLEPQNLKNLEDIDSNDMAVPVLKRRAKKIQ